MLEPSIWCVIVQNPTPDQIEIRINDNKDLLHTQKGYRSEDLHKIKFTQ